MILRFLNMTWMIGLIVGATVNSWAQSQLEESAVQNAVSRVAPSVVQIETIGGVDRVEGTQINEGPTTGVIISEDGLVVTSSINFVDLPASIVVRFHDGEMVPAEILARDIGRNLVVLKTATRTLRRPVEIIDRRELAVGQTCVAIGKIYDVQQPNISVGIVSALFRIWDRALQTDAKISPANFGGPLVDLHGRMIGVLTPLSPDNTSVTAGTEWYDSGIGFAVPIQDLLSRIETLMNGTDLKPGLLGVGFKGGNLIVDPPEVATSIGGGPAAKAGIRPGDLIVAVNERPVKRQSEFKHAMGRFYAGDNVTLSIRRDGGDIQQVPIQLVGEIKPFSRPAIGLLPELTDEQDDGVRVREVIPDSAAEIAGIRVGDSIRSFDGLPVHSSRELSLAIIRREPGDTVQLTIARASNVTQTENIVLTLKQQSATPIKDVVTNSKATSILTTGIKVSDVKNKCFVLLPQDSNQASGAMVWVPEPGPVNREEFAREWSPFCEKHNIAMVVPQSADDSMWEPGEADFIVRSLKLVKALSEIDANRVAIGGLRSGGAMAALTCFSAREDFRGLILVDNFLPSRISTPKTQSTNQLLIFSATTINFDKQELLDRSLKRLQNAQFPVHVENAGSAKMSEWADKFFGWVNTLDRL